MSKPSQLPLGMLAFCERCGAACKTAKTDPSARLLRTSETPKGYCLECAVTEFLQTTPPICYLFGKGDAVDPREAAYARKTGMDADLDGQKRGASVLLLPQVRVQMAAMFRAGRAQADERDINWCKVIEMWDLPLVTGKGRKGAKP